MVMMVIRVKLPARSAKKMKVYQVLAIDDKKSIHWLQVLSAYVDVKGQPNAMATRKRSQK